MSLKTKPEYGQGPAPVEWELRLYVTDRTPRCTVAYRKLKQICREHIKDKYKIEVVDLWETPGLARQDQIVAIPTLVKMAPKPKRILVGDFSNLGKVLKGLDIGSGEHPRKNGRTEIKDDEREAGQSVR